MEFVKYDLGFRQAGNVVQVNLGSAANVRLVDSGNLGALKAGRRHQAYGAGFITRSPHRIGIPHAGHWYVVLDLAGRAGTIQADVRVLG